MRILQLAKHMPIITNSWAREWSVKTAVTRVSPTRCLYDVVSALMQNSIKMLPDTSAEIDRDGGERFIDSISDYHPSCHTLDGWKIAIVYTIDTVSIGLHKSLSHVRSISTYFTISPVVGLQFDKFLSDMCRGWTVYCLEFQRRLFFCDNHWCVAC